MYGMSGGSCLVGRLLCSRHRRASPANPNYVPPRQPGGPGWGAPPPPQPPKKKHRVRNVLLGLAGLFVILVAIGAAVGGSHNAASSTSAEFQPGPPGGNAAPGQAGQPSPSPSPTHARTRSSPRRCSPPPAAATTPPPGSVVGGSGDWDIYWTYNEAAPAVWCC